MREHCPLGALAAVGTSLVTSELQDVQQGSKQGCAPIEAVARILNAHNEVPTVARERQTSQEVIKLIGGRHPLPVLFWQEGEAVGPVLGAERPGCWENAAVWQAQLELAGLAGCAARRGGEESQASRQLDPFPNQVLFTGQGEDSQDHLSSRLVAFMVGPKECMPMCLRQAVTRAVPANTSIMKPFGPGVSEPSASERRGTASGAGGPAGGHSGGT